MTSVPEPRRGLTLLVESYSAYVVEHGHQHPKKKITTAELKESLGSYLGKSPPDGFGKVVSDFLQRWNIKTEDNRTYNQKAFDIPDWIDFFIDLYRYTWMSLIKEGEYTYPELHEAFEGALSRYVCINVFSPDKVKKLHPAHDKWAPGDYELGVHIHPLIKNETDTLFENFVESEEYVVPVKEISDDLSMDITELKERCKRWNIDVLDLKDGEKLEIGFLREQVPRLL